MPQTNAPSGNGWTEKLNDGTLVRIRSIDGQDAELELEFLQHLSPEFRKARFLGMVRDPSPEVARTLTDIDPAHAMAFIALTSHRGRDRQIGAAQFHMNATGDNCDASLTVSGDWRKRGVGSLLMRHLIEAAKARGIQHMRAYVSMPSDGSDNLIARIGFQRRQDPRDPATVYYDLPLQ